MANTNTFEQLLFNAIKNGQQTVKSVYDIWLELGNTGTPQDFIDSLKGSSASYITTGVTIPTTAWVSYEGIYKATISDANITAQTVVNVNFNQPSLSIAINSGVLGYTNTVDGGFEIFSNFKPSSDLVIDYMVVA